MFKTLLYTATLSIVLQFPLFASNESGDERIVPMLFHDMANNGSWRPNNDTVMGGVSSSRFEMTDTGIFVFSGDLSLKNNGGFASVRSRLKPMDLADADAFRLRVRGDGYRYQLRFEVQGEWRWVNYGQGFDTKVGEWMEVELPVDQFRATHRGESVSRAPAFNPAELANVILFVSDKQEGKFQLEVDWIRAVYHEKKEALIEKDGESTPEDKSAGKKTSENQSP